MKNIATDIATTDIDTSHLCFDCGRAFHSDASRRRHEALARRRVKIHRCPFCGKCVNSSVNLQGHISVKHNAAKLFKCDQCPSEFSYKKTLVLHIWERHISEEMPSRRVVCHLCGKIVQSKLDLKGLLAHNHGWAKEFMCNVCGREFGYKQALVFHIRSSHSDVDPEKRHNAKRRVVCHLCGKIVQSQLGLREHLAHKHGWAKEFMCNVCGREFGYKQALVFHIRSSHSDVDPEKRHNAKRRVVCHLCGKIVQSQLGLREHLAHKHGWAKEFMCNVCGREFGYKQALVFHIRSSHSDVDPDKRRNAERLVLKRHVCHLCDKIVSKKNLRGHMAYMHGATKELKCEVCGMEFGYKNVMMMHMKTKHQGIKRKRSDSAANDKFVCQLCGKNVASMTNLKGHMSNEHGIAKEFGCNVCGKEFAYKHTMKGYFRVKHPEKN